MGSKLTESQCYFQPFPKVFKFSYSNSSFHLKPQLPKLLKKTREGFADAGGIGNADGQTRGG